MVTQVHQFPPPLLGQVQVMREGGPRWEEVPGKISEMRLREIVREELAKLQKENA